MDWQDQLADQVRDLEAKADSFDPALAMRAMQMLRTLRGYEVRVRHLAFRVDHRLARQI